MSYAPDNARWKSVQTDRQRQNNIPSAYWRGITRAPNVGTNAGMEVLFL